MVQSCIVATSDRVLADPMNHARRFLALALLGVLLTGGRVAAQPSPELDAARVSAAVDEYRRRNGVPGAIVVITDGADVDYVQGFGRDSTGAAVTTRTRLPIASLSKSFTALAVMQLVEQHRVDLDTPVVHYLPEFHLADQRSSQITVRQLLAHRSGMSDMTFREKSVSPVPATLADAVRALATATLASNPGERRSYHNPNYWVAARLVEVVSGVPFASYLRDHVFLPLGMTDSVAVDAVGGAPDVARGHIRILGTPIVRTEPAWFLGGCCGVMSTARDLAAWLAFHATGGRHLAVPIVSSESLQLMHDGLGWNTIDDAAGRRITHNGILFTFGARQVVLPDVRRGVGVAVVTNTGIGFAPTDADAIADMLLAAGADGALHQPPRVALMVDAGLVALTMATLLGGWLAVRRARRQARPRAGAWRRLLAIAGTGLAVTWLAAYPWWLRMVTRRDLNWEQSLDVSPLAFLFVTTLAAVTVAASTARWRAASARPPRGPGA